MLTTAAVRHLIALFSEAVKNTDCRYIIFHFIDHSARLYLISSENYFNGEHNNDVANKNYLYLPLLLSLSLLLVLDDGLSSDSSSLEELLLCIVCFDELKNLL